MSRNEKIIETLEELKMSRFAEIQKWTGLNQQTLSEGLRNLKKLGYVVQLRYRGPWALKKNEELVIKEAREFQSKDEPLYIANEVRSGHSEDLKNEVIKPWITQLPLVELDGVYIARANNYGTIRQRYLGEKLPVENEPLFEDFKKHFCFEPSPYQKLDDLKMQSIEFEKNRSDVIEEIKEKMKDELTKLNLVNSKWPYDSSKYREGIVTEYLPEHLLHIALLYNAGNHNIINKEYLPLRSTIESEIDSDYKSLHSYRLWGMTMMILPSTVSDFKEFRIQVDEIIMQILKEINNRTFSDFSKLAELNNEIKKVKEELKIVLVKHLKKKVFPGNCDYVK